MAAYTTEVAVDLGLAGARALITGGSRGLGGATAEVLAAEGARVALSARDSDDLRSRAEALGGVAVPADLATREGPGEAVRGALDALDGLDLMLINAGGPPAGSFSELSDEQWQAAIDGVFWSSIRLVRAAVPELRKSDRPAIAWILSSSVREPVAGLVTSNTIRPGLVGLIKSLVPEIAPIRINGIAPGRIATDRVRSLDERNMAETGRSLEEVMRGHTERIPLARYGEPDEFGRVGAFLLSPAASYVNGVIVPVDGGMLRALP
jgi:3-oxoacyl-[acyl-carrier protein] reductase